MKKELTGRESGGTEEEFHPENVCKSSTEEGCRIQAFNVKVKAIVHMGETFRAQFQFLPTPGLDDLTSLISNPADNIFL
ncbi:hypothetical protein EYF80_027798 [Liparis tanakae]|uniref:Uncharacterized protein n=1 Tax=Liparis tanakae TaxID=230148 RepID=A0A4Z2HAC5_9TELE|nr:hypothetical protein EYF80_027798 [Liparis tanakae]